MLSNSIYNQNYNRIEIEITSKCNLQCFQCDRSSAQAPSNEEMSITQIKYFVDESIKNESLWYEIEVLGGEPALHSQLLEIIDELERYVEFNPDCRILLITNGFGNNVNEVLNKIPSSVVIDNTLKKKQNTIPFNDFNIAPIDFKEYKNASFIRGCKILSECGFGLNRYGYYICGAGASIDRVFGFGVGIKSLELITDDNLLEQRKILCKHCGHFKLHNYKIRTTNELSVSWQKAYDNYNKKPPVLVLYGDNTSLK